MRFRSLVESTGFRARFWNVASKLFGGKRDMYKTLGYLREITPSDYRARFYRNAVANRVVKALPKATWRGGMQVIEDQDPTVETAFEAAFADLDARLRRNGGMGVEQVLEQADVLAGIGRYAVILIGAPGELDTPLETAGPEEIVYLAPYAEEDALIQRYVIDTKDPRFGLPEFYTINRTSMSSATAVNSANVGRRVHWTRCLHIAEGTLDDRVFGEPRLQCIWNLLDDLEKVTGGGAEAFWRRADQGIQFDLDPTLKVDQPEKDELKKRIEAYEHRMSRFLLTRGVEVKTLGSDTADFSRSADAIIAQISAGTGIPQRILMGSERGQLASQQDRSNWDDRVADRRLQYAEPVCVRQLVDRLVELGALPEPEAGDYDVSFAALRVMDDSQRATIAKDWAALNRDMQETVVTPNDIRERVLELPPLGAVLSEEPGGGRPPAEPAVAARKGGAAYKQVHRAADRFRPARPTYRERLLRRRARRHQPPPAGDGSRA